MTPERARVYNRIWQATDPAHRRYLMKWMTTRDAAVNIADAISIGAKPERLKEALFRAGKYAGRRFLAHASTRGQTAVDEALSHGGARRYIAYLKARPPRRWNERP